MNEGIAVLAAGFEQDDGNRGVLAEARRQHTSGRATADNDVISFHNPLTLTCSPTAGNSKTGGSGSLALGVGSGRYHHPDIVPFPWTCFLSSSSPRALAAVS